MMTAVACHRPCASGLALVGPLRASAKIGSHEDVVDTLRDHLHLSR